MSEVVREILEDALVEQSLADRVGRIRGSLQIGEAPSAWQRQIHERNWRP